MSQPANPVLVERDGSVATVRLNRPAVLNALDQPMWEALLRTFTELRDDASLRVCLITGNGRGFCSGADLNETTWHDETPEASRRRIDARQQQLARLMIGLPVPLIACVNGYALGGGAEIALAADIRLAARGAKLGFPEAAIGRFVTGGASLLLARTVGLSRAKRLLYTSDHIDADDALRIGLVDEVTEPEDLLPTALALAGRIADCSVTSVRLMKAVLDRVALADLESALAQETEALVETYAGGDIEAARQAFVTRE